jgi:hypothetical protein
LSRSFDKSGVSVEELLNMMDPALLDDVIRRLLEVKNIKPGKNAQLSESEIKQLCAAAKEIFLHQPNLLELEAPIKICGICPPSPVAPEQFLRAASTQDDVLGRSTGYRAVWSFAFWGSCSCPKPDLQEPVEG